MESPFESILYTNFVPSDAECGRIQDFVRPSQGEAATLTAEISRLTLLLNELTLRRDMLNKLVDSHLALVIPARRLPEDVIREIFLACRPPTHFQHPGMSTEEAPLLLCQICRAWRRVAIATPRLWSSLHVDVLRNPKMAEVASATTIWLSRSGILPLSISVESPYCDEPDGTDASVLLASLAMFAGRWGDIRLYVPHSKAFAALSHLSPPEDLPLLRTLSIGSVPDVPHWPWECLPIMTTPNLCSLTILDAEIFPFTHLPRTQLTELKIETKDGRDSLSAAPAFSTADALTMMRDCSALENCTLEIDAGDPSLAATVISLPQLSCLEVTNMTTGLAVDRLFVHLNLPKLDSLTYTSFRERIHVLPPHMFYPSLRFLILDGEALDGTSLVQGLRLLPHLHTLELNDEPLLPPESADFLGSLSSSSGPGGRPEACPNLQQLQLWNLDATLDSALLAFVQARTAPDRAVASRLTRLGAHFLRPKRDTDILEEMLGPLVAAGFKLSLSYRDSTKS
ncbi:hypothetical protein C8R46DRAFT_41507 [Mycena filopes]|nr:hypothetical protein C8R46DRAFT_41507 [Mycena filopes]